MLLPAPAKETAGIAGPHAAVHSKTQGTKGLRARFTMLLLGSHIRRPYSRLRIAQQACCRRACSQAHQLLYQLGHAAAGEVPPAQQEQRGLVVDAGRHHHRHVEQLVAAGAGAGAGGREQRTEGAS